MGDMNRASIKDLSDSTRTYTRINAREVAPGGRLFCLPSMVQVQA